MIVVPDPFMRATIAREGERGAEWIGRLPGLVEDLLDGWACTPDGSVLHGGVGLIVPVRTGQGEAAVLKVSFPHPGNVHEPDAFAAWQGRGAVRLHARDGERFALLLERADPRTLAELTGDDEVITVAGALSRRLAVPAPPGLPRLQDRAGQWEEELCRDARELPHGLGRRTLEAAVATLREVAAAQPDLLVHGDLHGGNILRAEREPWLAVDPKGLAGDPAYDGGTLLKSRALAFLAADDLRRAVLRALALFSDAAGLDPTRVRRWAQLHAVQAAFWARRHGFREARGGDRRGQLAEFAEHFAQLLTD